MGCLVVASCGPASENSGRCGCAVLLVDVCRVVDVIAGWMEGIRMSGFVGRILRAKAKLLGTAAQEIPVPFEVFCECGGRAAGIRRQTYQVADCSDCGRSLYVLPVNPYPATRRIPSEVVAGGAGGRAVAALAELAGVPSATVAGGAVGAPEVARTAESSEGQQQSSGQRVKRRVVAGREVSRAGEAVSAAPAVAQTAPPAAVVPVVPRVSLGVRLRRTFSPVRLLVTASLVLLSLTVWWMVQQRRQDVARRVWRQQQDAVRLALEADDLPQLTTALERLVEAAEILHRVDAEAVRASSLLKQCRAVNQLSQLDLVTALEQLVSGPALTDERVTAEVRGLVFVFEGILRPAGAVNGGGGQGEVGGVLELDLPLQIADRRVRIRTGAAWLSELPAVVEGQPVLFAAALEGGHLEDRDESLTLLMNDESVVLLTESLPAAAAGYVSSDAGVAQLLRRQSELLGGPSKGEAGAAGSGLSERSAGGTQ